jgi:hypothetical protein
MLSAFVFRFSPVYVYVEELNARGGGVFVSAAVMAVIVRECICVSTKEKSAHSICLQLARLQCNVVHWPHQWCTNVYVGDASSSLIM